MAATVKTDVAEEGTALKMNLVEECADVLLRFVAESSDHKIQEHYEHLHLLRSKIIVKQHETGRQTKIKGFFQPRTTVSQPAPTNSSNTSPASCGTSPQPGPSGEHTATARHDSFMEVVSGSE